MNEFAASNQQQPEMNINPDDLETVKCEHCGGYFWDEVMVIKRLSSLLSPDGEEHYVPIPVQVCVNCGKPIMDIEDKI